MKVLLVGANDLFTKTFLERMVKEDHEVYLLSKEDVQTSKTSLKHKFYGLSGKRGAIETVFQSVRPDAVVFAGDHYMGAQQVCGQSFRTEGYLEALEQALQGAKLSCPSIFVYLSSTAVYGNQDGPCTENAAILPDSTLGLCMSQGEYMVTQYGKSCGFETAILRCAPVYTDDYDRKNTDFIGEVIHGLTLLDTVDVSSKKLIQPVHAKDLVDAILRTVENGKSVIYNVAAEETVLQTELYRDVESALKITRQKEESEQSSQTVVDCSKIKKDLEWTDFHKLDEVLQNASYWKKVQESIDALQGKKKEKSQGLPAGIRKTLENLLVFAVFFLFYYFTKEHALFATVDWLLIYVSVISVFWGLHQSLLAIVLASGSYLLLNGLSLLEMSNFYSYADCVLMIAEFVFFGVTISYTLDVLKENVRDTRRGYDLMKQDYEELKEINRENVIIKQEYEKRLLVSKTGISKLYALVSKLMDTSPERVMMEILDVVAEMMETRTVAVYIAPKGKNFLRLVNARDKESLMQGKSWNIAGMTAISDAIASNRLFEGDTMRNEPAVVLPIPYKDDASAVIVIKDLPYTSQTLYHANMLRTLGLLITDSIARALDYEELTRASRCVGDTDILIPEEFAKQVDMAKEKADEGMAEYSLLRLEGDTDTVYEQADPLLRMTDFFGKGKDGKLYVLLNNTGAEDLTSVLERLSERGIEAETVHMEA